MLRLRRHPSKGDPRCFKTGKLTVHHQPFNKMTQSIFIILMQLSCIVSTNLNIFQNLFFFHLPDYSIKHFYVSFKSFNSYVQIYCNRMWGTYFLHRKTTMQFRYKRKAENRVKLTLHCIFISKWILTCCVLHWHGHP